MSNISCKFYFEPLHLVKLCYRHTICSRSTRMWKFLSGLCGEKVAAGRSQPKKQTTGDSRCSCQPENQPPSHCLPISRLPTYLSPIQHSTASTELSPVVCRRSFWPTQSSHLPPQGRSTAFLALSECERHSRRQAAFVSMSGHSLPSIKPGSGDLGSSRRSPATDGIVVEEFKGCGLPRLE